MKKGKKRRKRRGEKDKGRKEGRGEWSEAEGAGAEGGLLKASVSGFQLPFPVGLRL